MWSKYNYFGADRTYLEEFDNAASRLNWRASLLHQPAVLHIKNSSTINFKIKIILRRKNFCKQLWISKLIQKWVLIHSPSYFSSIPFPHIHLSIFYSYHTIYHISYFSLISSLTHKMEVDFMRESNIIVQKGKLMQLC